MSPIYANCVSYGEKPDQMDGSVYRLWRMNWQQKRRPIRLPLHGERELALILYKERWLVVDPERGDLPLLGWESFESEQGQAMQSPVRCRLNYYHYMAHYMGERLKGLVLDKLTCELTSSGYNV